MLGAALGCSLALAGCGGDDGPDAPVTEAIQDQLAYLDPESSVVAAVDLRYDTDNGERLRALVSRGLREYRSLDPDAATEVPPNVTGALELASRSAGLSFDDDVKPALDGYLVVGATVTTGRDDQPEARTVMTYRTREGDLEKVARKVAERERLPKVRGHDDALALDSTTALVGGKTLVSVVDTNGDDDGRALRAVLDRAENTRGFPAGRMRAAEQRSIAQAPLVLATADPSLAGLVASPAGVARARREVPYVRAVTGAVASVGLRDDRIAGRARVTTDPRGLEEDDLPVGPPGEVEVPARGDAIVGGTRDQSVTTAFGARVARSLFADSAFVREVERTERKLGIDFEREFLRQFDCPSISVFEGARTQRFAAPSCVRDPARMRRLLPRLAPELPGILTGLQRLPSEGLVALLLVAPDAPLTPSFGDLLGAVTLNRLGGGGDRSTGPEQLYELRGLRDGPNQLAVQGPDRVVFGMVGKDFVVGSDRAIVRRVARQETEPHPDDAASVTRIPLARLFDPGAGVEGRIAGRLFGTLEVAGAARREGTQVEFELPTER